MTTFIALDIDGTIFDAAEIVVPAFENGIKKYAEKYKNGNFIVPSREQIMPTLGLPIDEIFYRLFPDFSLEQRTELMLLCTDSFVELIHGGGGVLFEGVRETVLSLWESGYVFYPASNGRKEYVEAILKTYDIMRCFSGPMLYLDEEILDKTALVAKYKKLLGPDDLVIMIGDRYTDRDAAEINDIPFIGCMFGHASAAELEGCRWTVNEFVEIPERIKEIEDRCVKSKRGQGGHECR